MSPRELLFVADRCYVTEPARRLDATHLAPEDLADVPSIGESGDWYDDVDRLRAARASGRYLDYAQADALESDRALMNRYAAVEPPPADDIAPVSPLIWLPHPAFARSPGVASAVSELLLTGFGVLQAADFLGIHPVAKKVPPSKGARHPFVAYLVIGASASLPSGVFRYRPWEHALEALDDAPAESTELRLIVTMRFERLHWRYRETAGYTDGLLDLGHLVAVLKATVQRLGLMIEPASAATYVPDIALVEEAVLAWRIQ